MMIGKKIRKARETKGLTQAQLAELIGCTEQSILNWEKGASKPLPVFIKCLEQILEINLKEEQDEMANERGPSPN